MASLQYIEDNYLTLEGLSEQSFLPKETIQSYIDAECLPKSSYKVTRNILINSFLGQCNEESDIIDYFPISMLAKFERIHSLANEMSLKDVNKVLYERFINIYTETLHEHEAHLWGLDPYISATGTLLPDGKTFLDEEWHHYLNGTYGICTKTASAEDIALKEVSIAKIKFLLSLNEAAPLSSSHSENLKAAVGQLDKVSAAFAPYEVKNSSRQKYINEVRSAFGWR